MLETIGTSRKQTDDGIGRRHETVGLMGEHARLAGSKVGWEAGKRKVKKTKSLGA